MIDRGFKFWLYPTAGVEFIEENGGGPGVRFKAPD